MTPMKKEKRLYNFGVLVAILLAGVNLLHLPWTVWLTIEQARTGWGYGTNMEMMALLPWMLELLCGPVLLAGVAYLVISIFIRQQRKLRISTLLLLCVALGQYCVLNLFLFC